MEYILACSIVANVVLIVYFKKAVRAFTILHHDYQRLYKAFEKAAKQAGWKKVFGVEGE